MSHLLGASQPSHAELLQEAMTKLYNTIMDRVEEYVPKAINQAMMDSMSDENKHKMATIVEEMTWVPDMMATSNDEDVALSTKLAWLLLMQHNLAELKAPIFHE